MNDNTINFMAKEARGLICAPVSNRLHNVWIWYKWFYVLDIFGTQFTVSIDHVDTTTGISAYERTLTAKKSSI
ncbi:3,4-dihydroxy-2-butanone-4-phosphate synthase [Staphylococcus aureus]